MEPLFENRCVYSRQNMNEFFRSSMRHNVPFIVCLAVLLAVVVLAALLGASEILLWGQADAGIFEIFAIVAVALVAVFLLLRYRAKLYYERMCDLNGGMEATRTVLIGEDISIPDHSPNMPEHYRFSQIVKAFETKHLYILMTRSKIGIILAKDGFVKGTFENCKQYVTFQLGTGKAQSE